jgi:hypothetical protein
VGEQLQSVVVLMIARGEPERFGQTVFRKHLVGRAAGGGNKLGAEFERIFRGVTARRLGEAAGSAACRSNSAGDTRSTPCGTASRPVCWRRGPTPLTVSALLGHADGSMLARVDAYLGESVDHLRETLKRLAGEGARS